MKVCGEEGRSLAGGWGEGWEDGTMGGGWEVRRLGRMGGWGASGGCMRG